MGVSNFVIEQLKCPVHLFIDLKRLLDVLTALRQQRAQLSPSDQVVQTCTRQSEKSNGRRAA